MHLKVALVNPPPLAIVEPWYDQPEWGRLALAYLASYLRQFPDFEIRIIDAKLMRYDFREVQRRINIFAPDVVGLTAFTNEIKPAAYQAALIKESNPQTLTVVGGVHVTALPAQTLAEFPSFDVGVVGEGERTFYELCETMRRGGDLSSVAGLAFRDGEAARLTPARPRILDQDSIPHPAWDLFPRTREYWVQTVRGCPFNCLFCMNHNGRVARTRSVANVLEEIELIIQRYRPARLRFGDELFTVNMARSHELLDAMIERDLAAKVEWDCQTHVRFVDQELLAKMKRAGCFRVEFGIETGDEEKLRSMGKGTTMQTILAAGAAARRAGIPFGTFFIIGHPHETRDSIKKTIDLAVAMNPELPIIGIMCPYPGTEVSRLAAQNEGGYRLLSTDWDEYNKQIGGAMEFANLTRSQIEWIQIGGYAKVFLFNYRLLDFMKLIWQYRQGAWHVIKKALFKSSISSSLPRPADYEEKIQAGRPASAADIIAAREDWSHVQIEELARARRTAPHLVKISLKPAC